VAVTHHRLRARHRYSGLRRLPEVCTRRGRACVVANAKKPLMKGSGGKERERTGSACAFHRAQPGRHIDDNERLIAHYASAAFVLPRPPPDLLDSAWSVRVALGLQNLCKAVHFSCPRHFKKTFRHTACFAVLASFVRRRATCAAISIALRTSSSETRCRSTHG
jgi:hypothetical protein